MLYTTFIILLLIATIITYYTVLSIILVNMYLRQVYVICIHKIPTHLPFHKLQVAHGRQVNSKVGQCTASAIDDEDVQHYVIVMYGDGGLGVYGVGIACDMRYV